MNILVIIDLPKLQSIQLGWFALAGKSDEACLLIMRSMNEIE